MGYEDGEVENLRNERDKEKKHKKEGSRERKHKKSHS
jgi:hypothetical protein